MPYFRVVEDFPGATVSIVRIVKAATKDEARKNPSECEIIRERVDVDYGESQAQTLDCQRVTKKLTDLIGAFTEDNDSW